MSRRAGVSGGAVLAVGLLLAAVAGSFVWLDMPLAALFTATAVEEAGGFVARFFPPDLAADFVAKVAWASLETLAISLVSTLLAALGGALLALPAAGRHGLAGRHAARFVLNLLRSVPELVWATLMVLAAGLGPFAGTLALALHTTGVLGRLFAEALENSPPTPAEVQAMAPHMQDRGLLWRVQDGERTSWLYGTLHVGKREWILPGRTIVRSMYGADLLALELVHDAEHGFVSDVLVADDEHRLLRILALGVDDGLRELAARHAALGFPG